MNSNNKTHINLWAEHIYPSIYAWYMLNGGKNINKWKKWFIIKQTEKTQLNTKHIPILQRDTI